MAIELAKLRTDWRNAKATRGAVLVTSSPKTRIASADSICLIDGFNTAPLARMLAMRLNNCCSWSATPVQKFSAPTIVFSKALLSKEARGEPMPTVFLSAHMALNRFSAAGLSMASYLPSARRTPAKVGRLSSLTKLPPNRPRSHKK